MTIYETEEQMTLRLNALIKYKPYVFEWIINDENDEVYIPKVDFKYTVLDCQKIDLSSIQTWRELMNREDPIIFINTSYLFKQFEGFKILGMEYDDGAHAWAQFFYLMFRDQMWEDQKVKFIFLCNEENIDKMLSKVNAGFTIELMPDFYKKDKKILVR